jgi:hypothetical protein
LNEEEIEIVISKLKLAYDTIIKWLNKKVPQNEGTEKHRLFWLVPFLVNKKTLVTGF